MQTQTYPSPAANRPRNKTSNTAYLLLPVCALFIAGRVNVCADTSPPAPAFLGHFVTASSYNGGSAVSVAAADVNGDGFVDLISSGIHLEEHSSYLDVWTNNGSGGFVFSSYAFIGEAGPIITADLNGDGKADLVNANGYYPFDNTLSVLTNNGLGGFVSAARPSVGIGPSAVVAVDVNHDGKMDLVTANRGTNTLTVLTNNGRDGFTLASSPTVGRHPRGVAAADVNGDGKPDLISADTGGNTLTVLTNNGRGGFVFNATLAMSDEPYAVVAADVNGDGRPDLISPEAGDDMLTVLTNNGSGGFVYADSFFVGSEPYAVVAVDVNGDGKVDLVSANQGDNSLTVLTNNGSGGFAFASSAQVGESPYSVVAADFNGDGHPDLATANFGNDGGSLSVLFNTPTPGFSGALTAWGDNYYGQSDVPVTAQSGVTTAAAGGEHTVALKMDGSVVAWGHNEYGQTTVPVAAQSGVTAIAAGYSYTVALKNDGSVVAWGQNYQGQTTVPVAALNGVTAIAAGSAHTVALKNNGSVVAWGGNFFGQATVPVAAQSGVVAISAGGSHTVALKNDGSVVAWGANDRGQTIVPLAAQSGVTAIAAGGGHTVALKNDGAVVAWGGNNFGQTTVPVAAQSGVTAIAAGDAHSMALKNDGSVVAWGWNGSGQTTTPTGLTYVTAISAGAYHTVAMVIPTAPTITTPPASLTVNPGQSAHFTVTATGFPLNYQWRRDGVDLAGAISASYSLPLTQANQAGTYTVIVSNPAGCVTSAPPAVLAVNPAAPVPVAAWAQCYNSPANSNDVANAVAVDASGNVVVSGASHNGTNDDYYTAKYAASNGTLLWEKRYSGPANRDDYPWAMVMDPTGNVVVTGSSHNGTNDDYYTAKYAAATGALLWEKRYNGPANGNDVAYGVAVDGSGNVIVTGSSNNGTNSDFYTAKYAAANGTLLWAKRYNGPVNSDDFASAVVVDGNGNVIVTGPSSGGNSGGIYTVKYAAATGNLLWEKRYNSSWGSATAVAVDGSGNVVVTGYAYGRGEDNEENRYDYYTAKYAAATGALLWEKRFDWFDEDVPYAMGVDGSGNVIVTGTSGTFKYAAADGALLWSRYDCFAKSMALDGSGNVVVTGHTYGSNAVDSYTAKYAAADGALLWEIRADSPADKLEDIEHVLALGLNGRVVLTGTSEGTNGFDFETVVYLEPLPPVSIALVPAGVRLRFLGVAGHSYQMLRAPTVTGPWSTTATFTAFTNGLIEHLDTNAPSGSAFYRTTVVP